MLRGCNLQRSFVSETISIRCPLNIVLALASRPIPSHRTVRANHTTHAHTTKSPTKQIANDAKSLRKGSNNLARKKNIGVTVLATFVSITVLVLNRIARIQLSAIVTAIMYVILIVVYLTASRKLSYHMTSAAEKASMVLSASPSNTPSSASSEASITSVSSASSTANLQASPLVESTRVATTKIAILARKIAIALLLGVVSLGGYTVCKVRGACVYRGSKTSKTLPKSPMYSPAAHTCHIYYHTLSLSYVCTDPYLIPLLRHPTPLHKSSCRL